MIGVEAEEVDALPEVEVAFVFAFGLRTIPSEIGRCSDVKASLPVSAASEVGLKGSDT